MHDRLGTDVIAQPATGVGQQRGETRGVERLLLAVLDHVQRNVGGTGGFLCGTLLRALFAVQHVGARDFVLARAHQRQFDLVLDVLDVEGAAVGGAPQQGGGHLAGDGLDQLADARRRRGLSALHRDEGLGHGNGDLVRRKTDHRAVTTDDLVVGVARVDHRHIGGFEGGNGHGCRGFGGDVQHRGSSLVVGITTIRARLQA